MKDIVPQLSYENRDFEKGEQQRQDNKKKACDVQKNQRREFVLEKPRKQNEDVETRLILFHSSERMGLEAITLSMQKRIRKC